MNVDAKNAIGSTSLHMAIRRGHKEIVELLIKNGADVNIKYYRQTPLDIANAHDNTEIANLIKKAGGKKGD